MPDDLKKPSKPKLDAALVRKCTEPGKYYDTLRNGLILLVHKNGRKYWLQRLKINGKSREAGLGTYPDVSLAEARKMAARNQVAARQGMDPVSRRRVAVKTRSNGIPTFEEIAHERHAKLQLTLKRQKERKSWISALVLHAFPHIGKMPVNEIMPRDIEDMLMVDNLWLEKCETGRRVLQRTGNIMRYAVMRGYRTDDPTSALRGILVPQKKKKQPMRSLPYGEVPAALAVIRGRTGWPPVRLGMEFQILTAVRPGEVRFARWSEIDFEARLWTIPAERMKMGRELLVPLSDQAIAVLEAAREYSDAGSGGENDTLIFPSVNYMKGNPLSDVIFSKTLREMGLDCVPHGFRSSFRTWTQEQTNAPDKVAEAALGHANPNQVEGAYARSDYLDQRRTLMQLWADYLDGKGEGEKVEIALRSATA